MERFFTTVALIIGLTAFAFLAIFGFAIWIFLPLIGAAVLTAIELIYARLKLTKPKKAEEKAADDRKAA